MSALAALIVAAAAVVAVGMLCVPLYRIAEVLSEIEIRSAATSGDITIDDPEVEATERNIQALLKARRITGGMW